MSDQERAALAGASRALQTSLQRVRDDANIEQLCLSEDGMVEIDALIARFARLTVLLVRSAASDDDTGAIDQARELRSQAMRGHHDQGWCHIARAVYAMAPALLLAAERASASPLPE